jgi:SPP1 gp7 family putative phage head morphogenesis protein
MNILGVKKVPANVTPQILQLARQFRILLLARERRAVSAMVHYYGGVWRSLQGDISALRDQVAQMCAAGETISADRLWRLERMEAIQAQAAREGARFAQYADEAITAAQREAIAAGERDAHQLLLAGFPTSASVEISFTTMPREAVEALVGFLVDGSPLREFIASSVGEAVDDFAQTMVTGLAAGWNPRRLARELRGRFGMGLTDALRTARTAQLHAYRSAMLNSYRESGIVTEWERLAAHNDRTCLACIVLDGKRYTLAEEMEDHPQGRCTLLPITKTYAELGIDAPEPDFQREMARDWFQSQDEATQREMMGSGKWEAWQEGKFTLDDIPKRVIAGVWGPGWVERSLEDLIGE